MSILEIAEIGGNCAEIICALFVVFESVMYTVGS